MPLHKRKVVKASEPEPKLNAEDTLARIEDVTGRLEWLAARIEEQLSKQRGGSNDDG